MTAADFLSIDHAIDFVERYQARRVRFPDEGEATSLMVLLLNYGDHLTAVACVGGEWSGIKADLTVARGLPMCPNGHVLLEGSGHIRLALVADGAS